jgi:hypothetical protein
MAPKLLNRITQSWTTQQSEPAPTIGPCTTLDSALDTSLFQEADVLLFHHFRDPMAWIIRLLSGSYWNHAALVARNRDDGPEAGLQVVEAHWRGVRRWPLRQFLEEHQRTSVIAVRRAPVAVLDQVTRNKIARQAAEAVGSPYDFHLLLRLARLALRDMARRYRRGRPALPALVRLAASLTGQAKGFICSGLVQWSYWMAVEPEQRQQVLFVPGLDGPAPEGLLRQVTPEHLAVSSKLEWVCLLHKGQVWTLATPQLSTVCKATGDCQAHSAA